MLYLSSAPLIMVTITRHVFINILQTKHFLAVNFSMGYEKNMSFLVIAKSPKVEKIGLGSFKYSNSRGVGQDPSYWRTNSEYQPVG